jgi:AcrR family transcriptional regulator
MASDPASTKKAAKKAARPQAAASDSTRKQLMENEVLAHATRLFAQKGFAATNLQDVANSMGIKRPALYYYFQSKDELLERLIFEATAGPAIELQAIADQTEHDVVQRLHDLARHMVGWVAAHTDRFLLLVKSESDLSPESTKKFNEGRRATLNVVKSVIEEGVTSGHFRQVDPRIAALGILGICNWVAWWYRPGSSDSIESIADQLADMAVASVERADERPGKALSARAALAALREDLDRLEQSMSTNRSTRSRKR